MGEKLKHFGKLKHLEVYCFHDTCKWKLRANKIPYLERLWILKTYFGEHACLQYSQAANGNHRQATSRVIGNVIKKNIMGLLVYTSHMRSNLILS